MKPFFQTLGKFNQQTFRKSLSKNAAQLRGKESFTKETFFTFGKKAPSGCKSIVSYG